MNPGHAFIQESANYLRDVYAPRLKAALETLPPEDLWWQPHPHAISLGTILLHLEGNVRQWILAGLGDVPDQRERATEFSATSGPSADELMARLEATVGQAATVIAGLSDADLERSLSIQDYDTTGLAAIYHVVEHFSWHTGQAVWIAKSRAGAEHKLSFYGDLDDD